MLSDQQITYLTDNNFHVSELKTESVFWIYNDYFNIAVKKNCYDLFAQVLGRLVLISTICVELSMEDFIVVMDGFGLVKNVFTY